VGLATHLGPWLIGTVKYTTGTTAGTVRNVGATVVTQSKNITFANTTAGTVAFCLPAGSQILNFQYSTTTQFTGGGGTATIILSTGSTALTNSQSIAGLANTVPGIPTTAACQTYLMNTGTTDSFITFALTTTTTAGACTLSVNYVVRNADGTYVPNSFTGP
jgi:hypothetical protein